MVGLWAGMRSLPAPTQRAPGRPGVSPEPGNGAQGQTHGTDHYHPTAGERLMFCNHVLHEGTDLSVLSSPTAAKEGVPW